jgi:hypothetical protein
VPVWQQSVVVGSGTSRHVPQNDGSGAGGPYTPFVVRTFGLGYSLRAGAANHCSFGTTFGRSGSPS